MRSPKHNPARATRRPTLRFVAWAGVWMAIFYAVTALPWFERRVWAPYLTWNASATAAVLRLVDVPAQAQGRLVSGPGAALSVERGCDAIHPSLLLVAFMLATPASRRTKLLGVAGGVAVLGGTNLLRIVTLYFVQRDWPTAFELMHIEVWQAVFIFLALLLWIAWALWAVRPPAEPTRAPA
jgi:exosortase H (IPTLxxWG-CTERM-specific)